MKILLALFVIAWFIMSLMVIVGAVVHESYIKKDNQKEEV